MMFKILFFSHISCVSSCWQLHMTSGADGVDVKCISSFKVLMDSTGLEESPDFNIFFLDFIDVFYNICNNCLL